MKNRIKLGIITLFTGLTACQSPTVEIQSVNAEEFANVIADQDVQRLDVRSAEEYAEGHIAHSLNIDVMGDDFCNIAKKELKKDQTVALYCRSGRRSKKAAEQLQEAGFKVIELAGGFNEWKETKHSIEK